MPYESSFELINQDYGLLSSPKNLRSIRLKEDSFLSIYMEWYKFKTRDMKLTFDQFVKCIKIDNAINKLEKAKDEFKNLAFTPREVKSDVGQVSVAEKKVMKKATAIARLEEKVSILLDIPVSPEFVNNRAIKLKDNMMRNARFNSHNVYAVLEEEKNAIFDYQNTYLTPKGNNEITYRAAGIDEASIANTAMNEADRIILDETQNTAKSVQEIMNESANIRDDIIVVPDRDEVKKAVDDEFSRQEEQYAQADAYEVESVPIQMSREEAEEKMDMDRDKVKLAVSEAMNGVDISCNGAASAKIERYADLDENVEKVDNSFADGTYRLTREQIDEDFRKTPIEPRPNVSKIEEIKTKIPKIDISQVFGEVRDNKPLEKEVPVISSEEVEKTVEPTVVDVDNEDDSTDQIHFDYDDESISALTEAVDKAGSMDEIQALLARVKQLKEKQNESKIRAMEAKEKAAESEAMKNEAKARLKAYESALEEDLGYNERSAAQDMEKAKNNEALVEAMLSMIQPANDTQNGKMK